MVNTSTVSTSATGLDQVEDWSVKDQRITVTEGNGFLYNLQLRAKLDCKADEIYDILTDPNTVSIFRSIKECSYRKVLEQDGKGKRKLEVGHRAIAKFLFLSITFETHLHVWEDDRERTIRFQSARDGVMKKFDGCWNIQPFTQTTLDTIYHPKSSPAEQHKLNLFSNSSAFLSNFQQKPSKPEATDSLVTLEQHILPKGPAPPGVKGLIKSLCAKQIKDMMEDLRNEIDRRKNGTSTTVKPKQLASTSAAASMSLSHDALASLWDHVTPINIVIKL